MSWVQHNACHLEYLTNSLFTYKGYQMSYLKLRAENELSQTISWLHKHEREVVQDMRFSPIYISL